MEKAAVTDEITDDWSGEYKMGLPLTEKGQTEEQGD